MAINTNEIKQVILSPVHLEKYLQQELDGYHYTKRKNIFFLYEEPPERVFWKNTVWNQPQVLSFKSIKDAANQLSKINAFWAYTPCHLHRKAQLIQSYLKPKEFQRLSFLKNNKWVDKKVGEWTLIDEDKIVYCTSPLHPSPLGQCEFIEDKYSPPSRAYLKLWEIFTFYLKDPQSGSICLDMGSCPGGWTWVLKDLFSKVYSVDTAPIDEKISQVANVEYMAKDALKLNPKDFMDVEYLFSDMACTPEKLLQMIHNWLENSKVHTFACTIKLLDKKREKQILHDFLKISGSRIIHLYQNKHELTWIYQRSL